MESYREIYPQLPSEGTGENFRLKQCADWLSLLEKDLQDCEKIYKKYKRARSALLNLSTGSGTLSVALCGGGLGTGLTGVGLPVSIALGVVGGVCALTSVATASLAKAVSIEELRENLNLSRMEFNEMSQLSLSYATKDGHTDNQQPSIFAKKADHLTGRAKHKADN